MRKIETKWLPVSHFGFDISKIWPVLSSVTPDILFHITDLSISNPR